MTANLTGASLLDLVPAAGAGRDVAGGKARVLGELAAAGLPVPSGFVVAFPAPAGAVPDRTAPDGTAPDRVVPDGTAPDQQAGDAGWAALGVALAERARQLGGDRFAVRSSAAAEDLPDASYAGLYETYLNVVPAGLGPAVRRCLAAAGSERVAGYHARRGGTTATASGMAVLVQRMVDAVVAGVAFTAHPVTGDREEIVITAVSGLGERLVSGEDTGEEWTLRSGRPALSRPHSTMDAVLRPDQAIAVADLAATVARRYGRPQDIEWAIDASGLVWLLQARPMTALPEPVSWAPPGPGLWMRNFRLGEWLPEAVTPLFATWLLPRLEAAYLDGMQGSIGVRVPFRYALLNGWYYTAPPVPSPRLLARVIRRGRSRAVRTLYYTLVRVGRDPAAAERHALAGLHRQWLDRLPGYRAVVAGAEADLPGATPAGLVGIVDRIAAEAGVYLWFLAIVGGSAWKMEAALVRFCREHLTATLAGIDGGVQVLLRGLPGAAPGPLPAHAVQSVDWYHPLAGEVATDPVAGTGPVAGTDQVAGVNPVSGADPGAAGAAGVVAERHRRLAERRTGAEAACRAALADRPGLLARFDAMLDVTQRYAVIRERQAGEFTLGWPVLRAAALRLGGHLVAAGIVERVDDVFFCTRAELDAVCTPAGGPHLAATVTRRRELWERQRRLIAPLTTGRPPRAVGDLIAAAVRDARGDVPVPDGAIVGHPASPGRATGPVRVVSGPDGFAAFRTGEVLVATATAPAWTPLFARAAAVVTDGGTLAAHASLVAREYGIPAVVGTGDATRRLRTGQVVTVDGTGGIVTPATAGRGAGDR